MKALKSLLVGAIMLSGCSKNEPTASLVDQNAQKIARILVQYPQGHTFFSSDGGIKLVIASAPKLSVYIEEDGEKKIEDRNRDGNVDHRLYYSADKQKRTSIVDQNEDGKIDLIENSDTTNGHLYFKAYDTNGNFQIDTIRRGEDEEIIPENDPGIENELRTLSKQANELYAECLNKFLRDIKNPK